MTAASLEAVRRTEREASLSVVVCAYTDERWRHLAAGIDALQRQTYPAAEVILVVDHNAALERRGAEAFPHVRVIANAEGRGLSGARNTGVAASSGDVVVFLDDDAVPEETWLEQVVEGFAAADVVGVGGEIVPDFETSRPGWLPPEFDWVVGCSYRGLPTKAAPVRNPLGANMAFRREALAAAGAFVHGIGRIGTVPLGCEETELSIRVAGAVGGRILHLPQARVHHHVPSARLTWRYYLSRCWAEGLSKAAVSRLRGSGAALASERRYVTRTLPGGILRGFGHAARGDLWGAARAGAIVAGLAATTAGYVKGRLGGNARAGA